MLRLQSQLRRPFLNLVPCIPLYFRCTVSKTYGRKSSAWQRAPARRVVWLELRQRGQPGKFPCGFIYRLPNAIAQINSNIVSNLEKGILNETWLLRGVNIFLTETNPLPFLPQALSDIRLHHLVSGVTCHAPETCLDHIYSNEISQSFASEILVYGPSDHLPVFAVRQHFI